MPTQMAVAAARKSATAYQKSIRSPFATDAGLSMGFDSFTSFGRARRGNLSRSEPSLPDAADRISEPVPSRGAHFGVSAARCGEGRAERSVLEILEPIDVDEPRLRQRLAHAIDVEAELAGAEPLPLLFFLRDPALTRREDLLGLTAGHDDDAVVIRDDHVARIDERAGTDDRNVHRADGRLDGALRVDRAAPNGEIDLLELAHVSAAGIDHEASNAARLIGRAEQLSEHTVCIRAAERDDDDVAGTAELDRDMQHPVIAGMGERGHRRARNARARIDRTHVAVQQPRPPLSFV